MQEDQMRCSVQLGSTAQVQMHSIKGIKVADQCINLTQTDANQVEIVQGKVNAR